MNAALAVVTEHSPEREALRALLLAQLSELVSRRSGVEAGEDPDDLRRFRVATRRLRALLRAARPLLRPDWPEPVREELGWLAGSLGPARDLDVLVTQIRKVSASFEPGEQFVLARVVRQLEDERLVTRKAALETLASARCAALLERLSRELPSPPMRETEITLSQLAAAEFRRLRKAYRRLGGAASDDELHDLRLKVKRARYTAELARQEGGKRVRRFLGGAKVVQDILGEHQDASVAEARIRALLGGPHGVRWAVAGGRLIERQVVRRENARAALPAAWAALEREGRSAFAAIRVPGHPTSRR